MPKRYGTTRNWDWLPGQPTVAQKRARATAAASRLARAGTRGAGPEPVVLGGHKIAATFWGKAWCRNLESYSDFSNRLPRGRSYLRAGAVVDLNIAAGKIRARVAGSRLYDAEISIRALLPETWEAVVGTCGSRIDSMVALLEGRIPDEVMRVVTDPERGLFPKPRQIAMTCSCPDWAGMCKHIAASLYGVGARLDQQPELLFVLRDVDPADLVHAAASQVATANDRGMPGDLSGTDLGEMFGLEMAAPAPSRSLRVGRAAGHGRKRGRPAVTYTTPARSMAETKEAQESRLPRTRISAAKPTEKARKRPVKRRRASPSSLDEFASRLAALFAPALRTSRRRPKAR